MLIRDQERLWHLNLAKLNICLSEVSFKGWKHLNKVYNFFSLLYALWKKRNIGLFTFVPIFFLHNGVHPVYPTWQNAWTIVEGSWGTCFVHVCHEAIISNFSPSFPIQCIFFMLTTKWYNVYLLETSPFWAIILIVCHSDETTALLICQVVSFSDSLEMHLRILCIKPDLYKSQEHHSLSNKRNLSLKTSSVWGNRIRSIINIAVHRNLIKIC